ncbi:eukaryotic translation initiation factor 3 subunit A-like, partial [Notothenia coriiceps]|uniref:Eukaryotic translation initiation factor 3 subunit A-like n=1 Tax=Notothenia coriiceps TaxID=8208 RepID=A0A6I9NPG7_9TELE
VAQIYQSIEFTRLASLVPFVDAFQLERSIVDAARHCDLQVRIDHTSRNLSFGSDLNYSTKEDAPVGPFLQNMPSAQIRNQLTAMSSSLAKAVQVIKPASILQEREEQSQLAMAAYLKNARKDHQRILARRQTIEERKERLESLNIAREKEELELREAEMQKVRKAEEERLRQEAKEREKERIMQEHELIKKKTVRERLEQIKKTELGAKAFKDIDIEDLEELDPDFIMAKQVEQLEKEKRELQERLKNQEKKIDYFERAKRLEEIPLIKQAYEEQRIKDMELWELQEEDRISNMEVEREKALEHKKRMSRMMEDKESFLGKITAARSCVYEVRLTPSTQRSDFPADIVAPCRLQPVAIKLANKLVCWSPGSHSASGCQPLLRFSSGNHWNYSPDMLWIILLILPGLTPLLLPRSPGSWSLLPGSPALASPVLVPLHRIMPPLYSLSDLHSFNNRLPPDCMNILADNKILCKRRPPHRGSG